ncbi:MAG: tetratricopeptide repeat protein [Geminicoccaceae bacterium]
MIGARSWRQGLLALPLFFGVISMAPAAIPPLGIEPTRPPPSPAEIKVAQAQIDNQRYATIQNRLNGLTEQIRALNGRIEELEFENRQLRERLELAESDFGERIAAIESGLGMDRTDDPFETAPPPDGLDAANGAEAGTADAPTDTTGPFTVFRPADGGEAGAGETAAATTRDADKSAYEQGIDAMRAGDFEAARQIFSDFVDAEPDDPRVPEAAFWMAETRFVEGDHAGAAAAFARNYRVYGADAPKAADTLLKMGMSLREIGEAEKACDVFAELDREFPDAQRALRAAAQREARRAECG